MVEKRIQLPEGVGLHARPAAVFVRAAAAAPVEVTVSKTSGEPVSAKSMLAVMGLGVGGGEEIVLRADGEGAEQVLDELAGVLTAQHRG